MILCTPSTQQTTFVSSCLATTRKRKRSGLRESGILFSEIRFAASQDEAWLIDQAIRPVLL
jgi:hypothetical protein